MSTLVQRSSSRVKNKLEADREKSENHAQETMHKRFACRDKLRNYALQWWNDNTLQTYLPSHFVLFPYPIPAPLPTHVEDFDDTSRTWRRLKNARCIRMTQPPAFRMLKCNLYRPPMKPKIISSDSDEFPMCLCSAKEGCDNNCENKKLFLECALGSCHSLSTTDHFSLSLPHSGNAESRCKRRIPSMVATTPKPIFSCLNAKFENENKIMAQELSKELQFCANTVIQRKAFPPTEVFGTTMCGFGLRVLENVIAGQILLEYLGEVISTDELHDRIRTYAAADDFYFAALGDGLYLDAKHMGSTARFANHSCNPTCALQKWVVLGEPRICLVPLQDLPAGTEITYNYQYYQDGLDVDNAAMSRQRCLCGFARCCGTIGGRVLESKWDQWMVRTKVLLGNSPGSHRAATLAALEKHVGPDADSAGIVTDCIERQELIALIDKARVWQAKAAQVLTTSTHASPVLVDSGQVYALVQDCPKSLRFEEAAALKDLLKREKDVTKDIEFLETMWRSRAKASKSEAGVSCANVSASAGGGTVARLDWNELIRMLKSLASIFPLRSPRADFLFYAYQQCSNWSHKWIGGLLPKAFLPEDYASYTRKFSSIDKVSRAYGARLSHDVFLAEAFLEGRMTTALCRGHFDPEVERYHPYFKSVMSDVSPSSLRQDKEKKGPTEALYCFCRLPEDEGEVKQLICCDACGDWYHSNCINAASNKISKHQYFACPVCCFERGSFDSNFCLAPSTEWQIEVRRDATLSRVATADRKNNYPPKLASLPSLSSDTAPTEPCMKEALISSSESIVARLPLPMLDALAVPATATGGYLSLPALAGALLEEQNLCVIGNPVQGMLQLYRKYTIAWLHKVESFLSSPEHNRMASKEWAAEQTVEVPYPDVPPSSLPCNEKLSRNAHSLDSRVLRQALELYFELRLLKVRPERELQVLRQFVWTVSSAKLVFQTSPLITHSAAQNPDIALSLKYYTTFTERFRGLRLGAAEQPGYLPPRLEVLRDTLLGGRAVKAFSADASGCGRELFVRLEAAHAKATQALVGAIQTVEDIRSTCRSAIANHTELDYNLQKAVSVALERLAEAAIGVDLTTEFPFVSLMCVALILARRAEHPASVSSAAGNSSCSSQTTDEQSAAFSIKKEATTNTTASQEVYCYCRHHDYGHMIQCEHCAEWFHTTCISRGLTRKQASGDAFICPGCAPFAGQYYRYAWGCQVPGGQVRKNALKRPLQDEPETACRPISHSAEVDTDLQNKSLCVSNEGCVVAAVSAITSIEVDGPRTMGPRSSGRPVKPKIDSTYTT